MKASDIQRILNEKPYLRDKLFARGFYFTNGTVNKENYPFYGLWQTEKCCQYTLMVSSKQTYYVQQTDAGFMILIGHVYDPVKMVYEELEILRSLSEKTTQQDFWNEFNQLTGVFTLIVVRGDRVFLVGDPTCMQTTFYCIHQEQLHISSHTNLLGDMLGLEWDEYIKRLAAYRFFSLLGNSLPGDLTQFSNVKRLVPNHYMTFSKGTVKATRFYWPTKLQVTDSEIVDRCSALLHHNMELISAKWRRPAISMTGGCDSKTTLSCTNELYARFTYFSYTSSESEQVDADAAHVICDAIGQPHRIYRVSENDQDYADVEELRAILYWNCGGIRYSNRNDVRKRCLFLDTEDFDIEVKSWASEIGRAYYSKRFHHRTKFGKITPRKCTTMYKFFLHNRRLVRETDQVFAEYLKTYFEQAKTNPVEWQDQFFWEFRVPSWNGVVITGEQRTSFDITIPYNNRQLLELLLSAPIEDRINDTVYARIRAKMNPVIDATNIAVTNLKHTHNREIAEDLYYIFHSSLMI